MDDAAVRRQHAIRIARDVVEIVAIVAAGVWAFYVFVYENRIKPGFAEPQITFATTMHRTSRHGNLLGIDVRTEIRTIGTVRANLLGFALTVNGQRVEAAHPERTPELVPSAHPYEAVLARFYRLTKPQPVYGYAYLTNLADPRTSKAWSFGPGDAVTQERVFYVPAGRYDVLTANVDAAWVKTDKGPVPATLVQKSYGFAIDSRDKDQGSISATAATLDLDAP